MLSNGSTLLRVTSARLRLCGTVSGHQHLLGNVTNQNPVFTVFRMSNIGKFITQNGVWGMEKLGLVPKGTYDVGESLIKAQLALVKGGQTKLFT